MADNRVILKRSSVAAKVPQTSDLEFGEVALNFNDGRLYYKNSSGSVEFFEAGGSSSASSIETSDSPPSSPSDGALWWDSTEGNLYVYYEDVDSAQWVSAMTVRNGEDGADGTNGADGADGTDGVGVPVGGSSGDVLIKNSSADYDTDWSSDYATTGKAIAMAIVFG